MTNQQIMQTLLNTWPALKESKLSIASSTLDKKRIAETAAMIWELYRDKVLTSYQTKETLVCLGFTVVYDSKNEQLVSYR
jgi:hypothetical protein